MKIVYFKIVKKIFFAFDLPQNSSIAGKII